MANLIVFGMAVVFALIGSKQRLLKAWMILINAVFSVYIALWGADFLAGSLSLFNEKSEAYKYLCLIGGSWVVLMFVFHAAEKQLMPNPEEDSFPPFFDFLGGLLCGGAGGVVFAGTFALMLAVSPLSTRIPSLPQQEIEVVAGRVIETLTWTVDRLSFQADTAKKIAHLKELYYKEPGTEEETPENAGESDSGKTESEEPAKAPEKAAEASAQTGTGNDAPAREVGNSGGGSPAIYGTGLRNNVNRKLAPTQKYQQRVKKEL
mgnify:CR=1 FL=1